MKPQIGTHHLEWNGEIWLSHLVMETMLDRYTMGNYTAIDIKFIALHKGWRKERKSLNMIPMGVRKK
jgi:hypothetical protein